MSPEVTAEIIAASVSGLTLIGTLAAQYFGRRAISRDTKEAFEEQRKQLDRTLAEQRTRTLNERFATAAEQLGSDKPAVRLAGVYAMAGLADDWGLADEGEETRRENRQTCVDVLCAYFRLPYEPDPGQDAPELQRLATSEVRHTVIRVITAHLQEDAPVSWQGLNYDFTGAVFDGGDFSGAVFCRGRVTFARAVFSGGTVRFNRATFSGGEISFAHTQFSGGTVEFRDATFSSGTVRFTDATFSRGEVDFRFARFCGGTVRFDRAKISGAHLDFNRAKFLGGSVLFGEAEVSGMARVDFRFTEFTGNEVGPGDVGFRKAQFAGGQVDFNTAMFFGGNVDFTNASFRGSTVHFLHAQFLRGTVDFSWATFSEGTVGFRDAEFSGGTVTFNAAQFSGGTVDFSEVNDWSFRPAFPWTDSPPPGVKLPRKVDPSDA